MLYPVDYGRPDRVLFLTDSAKYRSQRLARTLFRERTFWLLIAVCVIGFASLILLNGGFTFPKFWIAASAPLILPPGITEPPWKMSRHYYNPTLGRVEHPYSGPTVIRATDAQLMVAAPRLYDATHRLLALVGQLMPGVKHIALQNYAELNDAQIAAESALAFARGEDA